MDYILNLPQILSKRTTHQQQAQPAFIILQRVWILQSLNTTWFNNLPLFDEDKSLVLVFDLIESEAVPARITYIQSNASYISRLDFHTLKAYFLINNRLFTRNNQLFLSATAENSFILDILIDFTSFK